MSEDEKDMNAGFTDPDNQYPKASYKFRLSQDVAQEAQAYNLMSATWVDQRMARLDRGIPIGYAGALDYEYDEENPEGDETKEGEWTTLSIHSWNPYYNYDFWGEPVPAYNAEYPYNEVYRSESGHVFEVDDTPGHERINRQHRTGTYEEIDENGSRSQKVIGSNYEIVCGDDFVYVKGKTSVTVDGSHHLLVLGNCYREVVGNETTLIRGDKIERVGGNVRQEIGGDCTRTIQGSDKKRVKKNEIKENLGFKYHWTQGNVYYGNDGKREDIVSKSWNQHVTDKLTIGSKDEMHFYTESDMTVGVDGEYTVGSEGKANIGSNDILNLSAKADAQLQADGNVDIDGSKVYLNTNAPGTEINVEVEDVTKVVEKEHKRTKLPESSSDRPFVHDVPGSPDATPERPGHRWTKSGIMDHIRKLFE